MKSTEWYLLENDARKGPYTTDQMVTFVQKGVVASDSLVWNNLMPEWDLASRSTEVLFEVDIIDGPEWLNKKIGTDTLANAMAPTRMTYSLATYTSLFPPALPGRGRKHIRPRKTLLNKRVLAREAAHQAGELPYRWMQLMGKVYGKPLDVLFNAKEIFSGERKSWVYECSMWYYELLPLPPNDAQQWGGPVDVHAIINLIKNGNITSESFVYRNAYGAEAVGEGRIPKDWTRAGNMEEFRRFLPPPCPKRSSKY